MEAYPPNQTSTKETPSYVLKKDVDPQEALDVHMDASTTEDTQSQAVSSNFSVGKQAAKTKDKAVESGKNQQDEANQRVTNLQIGAATVMVAGTIAAAAEVTVVTCCASGAAATGAGLSAGIAGPIVLAGASLLYAMHEQGIANKKQKECQENMNELESEFKNLSALAKGEKVEKASNEEQFITNAFNNCIKQNRLSHEKLDMLQKLFGQSFGEYNEMYNAYVDAKMNFKNPNQTTIDSMKQMIETGVVTMEVMMPTIQNLEKQGKEMFEKEMKDNQDKIMDKNQKLVDHLSRIQEETDKMTEQYKVLQEALASKIELVKANAAQAEKDATRQERVGWFQVFIGACAVVGGIVCCCTGWPILGALIIVGGVGIAGTALVTADAYSKSGDTKHKYINKQEKLQRMMNVTKKAEEDLAAQRQVVQGIMDRLGMAADRVKDYREKKAAGEEVDDSCFENPLSSHDVEMVREVVRHIEKSSEEFQNNFAKEAQS